MTQVGALRIYPQMLGALMYHVAFTIRKQLSSQPNINNPTRVQIYGRLLGQVRKLCHGHSVKEDDWKKHLVRECGGLSATPESVLDYCRRCKAVSDYMYELTKVHLIEVEMRHL